MNIKLLFNCPLKLNEKPPNFSGALVVLAYNHYRKRIIFIQVDIDEFAWRGEKARIWTIYHRALCR